MMIIMAEAGAILRNIERKPIINNSRRFSSERKKVNSEEGQVRGAPG